MSSEVQRAGQLNKVNANGDIVLDTRENGGSITETVRFGIIKLMGDKHEYRVKGTTLANLYKLEKNHFKGSVAIKELEMNVPMHQIVLMRWEEEELRTAKDFTKAPTEWVVFLDGEPHTQLRFSPDPLWKIERTEATFWYGRCHFTVSDAGEKSYWTQFSQVKELLHLVADPEWPNGVRPYIDDIYRYGVRQKPFA